MNLYYIMCNVYCIIVIIAPTSNVVAQEKARRVAFLNTN